MHYLITSDRGTIYSEGCLGITRYREGLEQFVINGVWVQPYRPGEGFLYEEMSKLLGISDEPAASND